MIIDGFTPGIVTSRAQPYEYNFELIANVLGGKQSQFNQAYEGLNNLRRQSLSIQFLNKSAQSKVDQYNEQVGKFFQETQELGDLSNPKIARQYANLFQGIASDRELISAYHKDRKIQAELKAVEDMKTSSDPAKAGFHPINYAVYLNHIQEYMDTDYTKAGEVSSYVPYVDINKEMAVLMREIPIEKSRDTIRDGQGGMVVIDRTGRNPMRVQAKAVEYLQSKGYPQLRQQAEYYFNTTIRDEDDRLNLYSEYSRHIDNQLALAEQQKTSLQGQIPNLKDQELLRASQELAELDSRMSQLRSQQMSPEEYLSLDKDNMIDHMVQIQMGESIGAYTNTYGGYAESKTYEPDRVTLELMKLQQDQVQFEANYELELRKEERLSKEAEAKTSTQVTNGQIPPSLTQSAVNDPTTVDMGSLMATLNGSHQDIQKSLANPLVGIYGEMVVPKLDGMWQGDSIPAGFENNFYMQALQIAMDDARKNGMTKQAGLQYAQREAERILKSPRNAREVQVYNAYTDAKANQEALAEFIKQARESGNPTQYLKDRNMVFAFQYGRTIVDPALWNTTDQKAAAANYRNYVWNQVKNNIGFKAPDNNRREFSNMNYVSDLPIDMIESIETRANGNVTLTFKPEAFAESTDNKPAGPLNDAYVSIRSKDGLYEPQKFDGRSLTVTVPQMATTDFSKNLGIYIYQQPQTRYAINKDNQPVPFDIYRNTAGMLEYRVNGGKWVETKYTTPEGLIDLIRSHIQTMSNAAQ